MTARTRRAATLWKGWLVLGGLLALARLLLPGDGIAGQVVADLAQALTAAAVLLGVRLHRPAQRLPWYLFAAAMGCVLVANVVLQVLGRHGTIPFPSVADGFYLAMYPLVGAGLVRLIRSADTWRSRAGLLDTLIISSGLFLTTYLLLLGPLVTDAALAAPGRIVATAYPFADLVLLSLLIRYFTAAGRRSASFWQLMTFVLLTTGADLVWLAATVYGTYTLAVDPVYVVANVLLGGAALHPSMRALTGNPDPAPDLLDDTGSGRAEQTTVAPAISPVRILFIGSACLLTPALLIPQGLLGDGRVDWLATAAGCILMFSFVIARMVGLVRQVQDQAAQLAALAHVDALTTVPNRRAWDLEIERRLAAARRHGEPLIVALLDLDHFKEFNDRHGHQAGDRLLHAAAVAWRSGLRPDDLIARYGGEEFGIILTRTRLTDAERILRRLLTATPQGQTFSAGVALWGGSEPASALVERADEALYAAKRAGRNRVYIARASHQAEPLLVPA